MPHHISELLISVVDYIPALFLEKGSPNFLVVRTLSILIVVALLIAVFALVGHFRFKRLSLKTAPGQKNSVAPSPPYVSERSNSAKVLRMPAEPPGACNSPQSSARR